LADLGIDHIFGLSTQDTEYQREVVTRLHLNFPILSDEKLELTNAMKLPKFELPDVGVLLKRTVLLIKEGKIVKVFYPVFPPDKSAQEVVEYLRQKGI
jgi:peroxiredoxin